MDLDLNAAVHEQVEDEPAPDQPAAEAQTRGGSAASRARSTRQAAAAEADAVLANGRSPETEFQRRIADAFAGPSCDLSAEAAAQKRSQVGMVEFVLVLEKLSALVLCKFLLIELLIP